MKTFVFNLNGALANSQQPLEKDILSLLCKLLTKANVAIISGSSWKHLHDEVAQKLGADTEILNRLYLLPTSGGALYQVWGKYGWVATYQHKLSKKDVSTITKAFEDSLVDFEQPARLWGRQIENREVQVTFSALGQRAPLDEKEAWDPSGAKLKALAALVSQKLGAAYEVRVAGLTSINVTLAGINKKSGLDEMMKRLHISKDDVLYVGNSFETGGHDYAAVEMGLNYTMVDSTEATKELIESFLNKVCLEKTGS